MALRKTLGLALAALAASCTSQGVEPREAGLVDGADGLAVVRIESTVPAAAGSPSVTMIDAVFARYEGIVADDVLELLGRPARTEPLAGCRWGATETVSSLPVDAVVDLLDVGTLHVELGGERTALEGRIFPSVQSLVAGTIYAEELVGSAAPAAFPPVELAPLDLVVSREIRVVAAGAGTVGQLDVILPAPQVPAGVLVAGALLAPGLEVSREKHLVVQWDAGDPHDRVEIELRAGGRLLRCTTSDQGAFTVRAEALSAMPEGSGAQLSIGRVRSEPFDVVGIDEAFARLVARSATPVVLR